MIRIEFTENSLATDPQMAYVAHIEENGQPVAMVTIQGLPKDAGWQGAVKALAAQIGG